MKLSKRQIAIMRQVALHLSVIGLLCLWVISINRTSDQFLSDVTVRIDKIEGGKDLVTTGDIKNLVTKELPNDIMNQSITRIDLNMIERLLMADTRIFDAEVYVDAQQKLVIEILQRRPVMRVMNQQGDQYYVDQAGFYVRKGSFRAIRVPVVTGYVESYDEEKSFSKLPRLQKAFAITTEINKDPVVKALIEQIHFEKKGRVILIPKIGNEKIVIDHVDQLERKLKNLKTFYRQLAKTDSWKKYDEIDISYYNQVVPRNLDKP